MRVTHISEDTARTTTRVLLENLPEHVRKDRMLHPAVVNEWLTIMLTEFRGYAWREDLGVLVKQS